jgi:chromosome segregation ATPase
VDLAHIETLIREFAESVFDRQDHLHKDLDEIFKELKKLRELVEAGIAVLGEVQTKLDEILEALDVLDGKIDSLKVFVDSFKEDYGDKIVNTEKLAVELMKIAPETIPVVFTTRGGISRLLYGQD